MKNLLVLICAVSTIITTPAWACTPFQYAPTVADARVLTKDGKWRPIHIEADRGRLRIEYGSSSSPSGRVAIIGNVEDVTAVWFQITADGTPLPDTHIGATTWNAVLSNLGLNTDLLGRYGADWAPIQKWDAQICRPAIGNWGYNGTYDVSLCIHIPDGKYGAAGFPLYALNGKKERVFEVTKIRNVRVSEARLQPPSLQLAQNTNIGCGRA